ncbi:hypothetical protein ZEAMMB73_Zm00001d038524 [Zea mays]|uniref:Uncharacterized protein n=1 Tax=Zea mays TaxID=4577 RepID=A0A1D6M6X5_MAIZE|nr:hypothetical protein ZEAMMB73_Zm00001d038524 [Zea mays]
MTPSRSLPSGHRPPLQVEKHFGRCLDARKAGDWKSVLRESDAAIAAGADSCALLLAARAEALFRLNLLDEADVAISSASKLNYTSSCSPDTKLRADSAHAQIYPPLTGVFKPLIKEGNVYNVSYIQIKKANRMYKPVDNDILIGFTKWILCW